MGRLAVQHLTFKNLVIAFLLLNCAGAMFSATDLQKIVAADQDSAAKSQAAEVVALNSGTRDLPVRKPRRRANERPAVVKVLDLPDTDVLRYGDTLFVDLGWRYAGDAGGEWVGYIGSGTEYLPLDENQMAGLMQEANLTALPRPPISRVENPPKKERRKPVVTSEPASKGIGLTGWLALLMSFATMMYIRYRIMKVAADATQGAAEFAKRAVMELLTARGKATTATRGTSRPTAAPAKPIERPVPVQVKAPKRTGTVVRASPGIFGLWPAGR